MAIRARKARVALLALLALLSLVASTQAEPIPKASVIELTCPSSLSVGQPFTVNASVSYSYDGWTLAEVGLFNANYTSIFDYVHYYLTGAGVRTFTLQAVAPSESSELQLRVTTRFWYQEFWIAGSGGTRDCTAEVTGNTQQQRLNPSDINIGQNEWYYWNNRSSDALLIWLSGGHAFSDHITVNPYEMESFGVMRFISDLSTRYSVLALRAGTEQHSVALTGEPYGALGYYTTSTVLKELHDWGVQQGYNFTYLIGYSTGGVAAGYEVAVRDPDTWAAPNGAVIVGAPLDGIPPDNLLGSTTHAYNVKADLELLYGEIWSDTLWPQGLRFLEHTPNASKVPWYLKEWMLFPAASHGVWETEQDGSRYVDDAFRFTSQFIDRSKSPFDKKALWNDAGIEAVSPTDNRSTGEQRPGTTGADFTAKPGSRLKVKVWLYDCTTSLNCTSRTPVSDIRLDLYSSVGYLDTRYTNGLGYEEFIFMVPESWQNKTVKLFVKLGGDFRDKYSPTVNLIVLSY